MCNKPVSPPQDVVADKTNTPNISPADLPACLRDLAVFLRQQKIPTGAAVVEQAEAAIRQAPVSIEGLKEPDGWFLFRAAHQHTDGPRVGGVKRPLPHADGPYVVLFHRYLTGGLLAEGRGHSLVEAWANACDAVAHREVGFRRGERG